MIFISNFPFENRIVRTARRSKTDVCLYHSLSYAALLKRPKRDQIFCYRYEIIKS